MKVRLTDEFTARATCPPGKKDVLFTDDRGSGLALRVTATGARVFLWRGRIGQVVRTERLGPLTAAEGDGGLTVAAARKKAEKLRGYALDKRDVVAERRAKEAAARQAEAEQKAAKARAAYTVGILVDQWAALKLAERSQSYRTRVPREIRRALSKWLDVPAASFAHADAVQVLDQVKQRSGPIAANRLRAVASACWAWSMKRGSLAVNPWQATEKPSAERPRERVLSDAEIADLWHAAGTLGFPWCGLLRAMLLTGQRRGEVAGMHRDELELARAEWRLPGERVKNGHGHVVPLSAPMLALLAEQPRSASGLVFEGARGTAPTGLHKPKERLDRAMRDSAQEDGRQFDPWVLHDIRRTVATGLQRLGVRLEVTEALLNHVSGSRSGIVGVYQKHGWDTEKRAALDAWAMHVLGLAEGTEKRSGIEDLAQHRQRRALVR
jgi:integrase